MLVLAAERIISIPREETGKTDGPLQLFIFSHPQKKKCPSCPSPSVSIHPRGQAAFKLRARLRLPRQPLRSSSHHRCHGHSTHRDTSSTEEHCVENRARRRVSFHPDDPEKNKHCDITLNHLFSYLHVRVTNQS